MSAVVVSAVAARSQAPARSGKRGNRGRGGSRGGQPRTARPASQSGDKTDEVAESAPATTVEDAERAEAEDTAVCWICAEHVKYYAVAECNHRTCHVCSLRLRALYKKTDCTFCKDPQPIMVFTPSPEALFASFETDKMVFKDAKLGIYFETQEMMEETLLLLRFNCPDAECDYIGNSWSDLKLHVRATHGRLMCDICIRHKKVFAHEHGLYPPNILALHLPSMLSNPRSNKAPKGKDKQDIEGGTHPLCEFCRECFFSDDELFAHMREAHEECFVCKRDGVRDQYFLNYPALEAHFTHAHHPCPHGPCLARKFVVFGSALDLQAHLVEEHGGEMGKGGRRDARRVEAGWDEVRAGPGPGGRGRGRERERDRDRDRGGGGGGQREAPPHQQREAPPHQPQPVPAQVPAQAQRAPGGGRRREGFGAALTVEGESTPPAPTPTPSPPPPRGDVDPAVAERHSAFLARLASLAPNPTTALPAARAAIRSFRAGEAPARDLVSTVFSILDRRMEAAASIVNALVDLLEEGEQRTELLGAWRGFEVEQRRQFPDLVPGGAGSGYAGIASGRVLSAKHATAARGGRQVWDRVAQAASSSQRFPALASGAAGSSAPRPGQRNTPWSASAAGVGFAPSASFVPPQNGARAPAPVVPHSTHMPAAPASGKAPPKLSNSLFPELAPSAAARPKAQVRGNVSLRNILGSSASPGPGAWGPSAAGPGPADTTNSTSEAREEGAGDPPPGGGGSGKKKGKGKGKQTLFTLGTFPS
ncbi:hypothetical protein B0H15DRAFT_1022723 [Mycena belliarum]|uniref:RING-type E3 ubiquitin transferase n=1 Tax=Mycena belliarum TaxID=1033014 RepID=A0AAD6U5K1_9AGAR|nr:hypothetical protein B0H15DRAFT_1022723 [Mycena belliae]